MSSQGPSKRQSEQQPPSSANPHEGWSLPTASDEYAELSSREMVRPSDKTVGTVAAYRPTKRPPIAMLTVFDDGSDDGEIYRLRSDRWTIGRDAQADLVIPHDPEIAPIHAIIHRSNNNGQWIWKIVDENSTSGLFIRVSQAKLSEGKELLAGRGRYRFEVFGTGYAIRQITADGSGERLPLTQSEHWIGRNPACDLAQTEDDFLEDRHVRISRSASGSWTASHQKTVNGLWLRVPEVAVTGFCHFQLGEQRFLLKVCR